MKKWNLLNYSEDIFKKLTQKLNVSEPLAKIISGRPFIYKLLFSNIVKDYNSFLSDINLIDIDKATTRIEKAIKYSEKVCIYGDYDADGVTSTAMLYTYLRKRGANVFYYIPDRTNEGYGLNIDAINKIHEKGTKLIVTVDNGISAVNEVDYAKKLNIDVVITDHHKVPEILPKAFAIVDPCRLDCPSKFKALAGVGVVFCLICFMEKGKTSIYDLLKDYSIFALIGTIGDVVALESNNRILVSAGLKNLNENPSIGIKALLGTIFVKEKNIKSSGVTFSIVPKINAIGRLENASKAVKLLVNKNEDEAKTLAKELININKKRKEIENEILEEIYSENIFLQPDFYQRILIIYGNDWKPGIIGIIAAKLLEKYHKPVIVISKLNENVARGSARSVPGFSIYDAIVKNSDYLLRFGGHPLAAGFDIAPKDVERFKKDILNYANKLEVPPLTLNIDTEIEPEDLTYDLANGISILEPFGKNNEKPVFKISKVKLEKISVIGSGKHLKLYFSSKNSYKNFPVLSFFTNLDDFSYKIGDVLDLAVNIEESEYNGTKGVTTVLIDAKFSDLDQDELIFQKRVYEDLITQNYNTFEFAKKQDIKLSREGFAIVYRFLKMFYKGEHRINIAAMYHRLGNKDITFCKFLLILNIFDELKIIDFKLDGDLALINVKENKTKVLLENSKILSRVNAH